MGVEEVEKYEAEAYLDELVTDDFASCIRACLKSAMEDYKKCEESLTHSLSPNIWSRLYSDLMSACISHSFYKGDWRGLGMSVNLEPRGAYLGAEISNDNLKLVVMNRTTLKPKKPPAYAKECIDLNAAEGREGKRGAFLLYEFDEAKELCSAEIVMRNNRYGILARRSIYPNCD